MVLSKAVGPMAEQDNRRSPVEPVRESYQHAFDHGVRIVFEMHEVKGLLDHIDTLTTERDDLALKLGTAKMAIGAQPARAADSLTTRIVKLLAERDALRARPWIVYDPYDGIRECESEQHALDAAEAAIDGYLADGSWDEDVESIVVAQRTHVVVRRVLAVKAEMTPDKWDELTDGSDADEWWHFDLVPLLDNSPSSVEPVTGGKS